MSTNLTPNISSRVAKVLREGVSKRNERLVNFLFLHGSVTTGTLASNCQIGNISAAVAKLQPMLNLHGLHIRNYPPKAPIQNRYGERTKVNLWELLPIEEISDTGAA